MKRKEIIMWIYVYPNWNIDGDQLEQTPISNYSCDPLQGIGGPMTRANTKRMKQALQGLIMEI